ncbi:glycoside hydrolase family 65 protein [Paenibacillus thiaminolyticus]|uniref:Glycoside hydrolase family 65 protein n=1 Tax=Paenibacillus thiaminolyticus TaxID=49283 RepID=A0A3A3H011_PANTH|nr:glycosyl hydrolase family 65 protein [Paenibacillus thiaminolyticus]RJG21990.1 glycoside hydrolase family 65 protein [Paenibacillus thiaminolyticus]
MLAYDNTSRPDLTQWSFTETEFNPLAQGKCESIMSLGNGYMGLRSATEEAYIGQTRNLFVNGTFNRFDEFEVTELPNAADVTRLDIYIDGERFSLDTGKTAEYARSLNMRDAELTRSFVWENRAGKRVRFAFYRFVSLDNLHLIGMKVEVTPLDADISFRAVSGIDAQLGNSGSQHFHEGEKRIFDKTVMQLSQTTTESKVDFVIHAAHRFSLDGQPLPIEPRMEIERRKMAMQYGCGIKAGQTFELQKLASVHTSRDAEHAMDYDLSVMREQAREEIRLALDAGYDALFERHRQAWAEVWNKYRFRIESKHDFDLLALRFAVYHLVVMTPAHDNRMGIGAKGLSGEGYKGHSFWDTEIFILPFYIYSRPDVARKLLEYRYQGLEGARRKAKENGYEGAMYPWEAAWPTDGEVTPVWGAVDIVTGKQTKIWSGFIEQHITSDIAYAVWHYVQATGDRDFMDRCGYEMILDTAKFWASRLEWNEAFDRYEINEVIGPDEYKEHVDNNAFTNYMAHFNMELAIQYYELLQREQPELFRRLNEQLDLERAYADWKHKIGGIYLPQPNEDGVIPQDDTYLQKQLIDLTKYKAQQKVGTLFEDYNLDQVNEIQVSKQADIMMLFYLLENRFSAHLKRTNYNYYEPKTLHDSSLSYSTHCILANDFDDSQLAYELFRKAAEIDLGTHMHSSDAGIHSASLGGVWQCVVMGFAGIRMLDGQLHLNPKLPQDWERLTFPLYWKNARLEVDITHDALRISTDANEELTLIIRGTATSFVNQLELHF